ncbi:MAG: ribonuclease P protein component [Bdellovibrionales bacterium]|jgi:ribonuclease P protein component|nr:ribonuclease P protein component [Bdellovibrionales bacterium]
MCAGVPTLKTSHDFRRIAQTGQKWVTPAFIMQISKNGNTGFRLGLTVSRKVGNAVVRNRAKRRLREAVRLYLQQYNIPQDSAEPLHGIEIVLIGRTAAADIDFVKLQKDLRWALKSLGVITPAAPEAKGP